MSKKTTAPDRIDEVISRLDELYEAVVILSEIERRTGIPTRSLFQPSFRRGFVRALDLMRPALPIKKTRIKRTKKSPRT